MPRCVFFVAVTIIALLAAGPFAAAARKRDEKARSRPSAPAKKGAGKKPKEAGSPKNRAAVASKTDAHPLKQYYNPDGVIKMLEIGLSKIKRYRTYTYTFVRCERIDNKLTPEEHILVKIRHRPFGVYMKWINDPELNGNNAGREVLYVDGKYDGKFVIHLGPSDNPLFPFRTHWFAPNDRLVRSRSRHPITQAGLKNLLKGLHAQFLLARKNGDLTAENVQVSEDRNLWFYEDESGKQIIPYAVKIVRKLPKRGDQYYCKELTLHLDPATCFPIRAKTLDWNDSVLEIYTFKNTKRASFTDADFDYRNPSYNIDPRR